MTATSPQATTARQPVVDLVGEVAATHISALQRGYRADRSSAVAALAQLRRGAGKLPEEVPELWGMAGTELLYSERDLPERDTLKAEFALFSAITLYALHQQSKSGQDMHRPGVELGTAVRRLMPGGTLDEPIRRRFVRLGTATTPKVLTERLREVVILLRNASIGLDYGILARQLYQAQDPDGLRHVRQRWGRSFHSYRPASPRTDDDAAASPDKDT
ncbi:type I-E CRISPR-associated protein Cse2/CasB [Nonomuraea aridisoli]|uniref:Type I-E CRISPR-associated protein Cse2/CasB n=1 Tax=Nonomuraea aridisoli TaxID=2070368 RepID=A0A2W2FK92_9ACTN|nr:type I-E CRISPR-associated protein Cse2/CasB [Nonomuraea aridisoli]PZG15594.1 type I-E CRISPR-associated protein Cse2/CasB [Nonomuraea aridisoli]